MARSVGLAHVVRHPDGTYVGVWGGYLLRTAFQPIFAFDDGRLAPVAFEGLIRPMRDNAAVAPGTFFGLIPPIDRMHVETLARTLHLLNAGLYLSPTVKVFVNFDPSVFVDRELTETTLRDMRLVLHQAGLNAERVVCEVTEHHTSSEATLFGLVEALRGHGFRIAVDDYGAEDSDIHRIERLKPDIVKFDARWITTLMNSGPGFALLSEMVSAFAARGIATVFEGIEHAWQLELAERSGAAMVQGFVVGKPSIVPSVFPHGPTLQPVEHGRISPEPGIQGLTQAAERPAARAFGRRSAPP